MHDGRRGSLLLYQQSVLQWFGLGCHERWDSRHGWRHVPGQPERGRDSYVGHQRVYDLRKAQLFRHELVFGHEPDGELERPAVLAQTS